jgi:class 3 adenylate cyclase
MKHTLAVILYADVVGYSRLTGIDEEATLTLLRSSLNLFTGLIEAKDGKKIKEAGDAILAEFNSAVAAVESAIDFQKEMSDRNQGLDSDHRFEFRIGINLGEIIHDRNDIFGDGVNIAARIQDIAEPGAITISASVHEQVKGKIDKPFHDLGFQKLKNIDQTVQIFSLDAGDITGTTHPGAFLDARIKDQPLFDLDGSALKKGPVVTGGCLCGAVRFEITEPKLGAGFCHCRICQRALGAALNAWAAYPTKSVEFTNQEPKYYRSSMIAERGFCPDCGTSLTYRMLKPEISDFLAICIPAHDQPAELAPAWHSGIESRLPWLNVHDDLPRMRTQESPSLVKAWHSVGRDDPDEWKPGTE